MSLPISLGDVVTAVDFAITIYDKIKDAPERIEKVGKGMKSLKGYLEELKGLLSKNSKYGLAAQRPTLVARIKEIIDEIETDAVEVQDLLDRWFNKIGPGGLPLRFAWFADALYAIGSNPSKLDDLTASLEKHQQDLDRQLALLSEFGQDMFQREQKKQTDLLKALLLNADNNGRRSPSPGPKRFDYGIIFIDRANEDRSIISEAYCKLVRGWTQQRNGLWRIKFAHSAGYWVKSRSDCVDTTSKVIQEMHWGNKIPNKTAMDALFDNNLFKYPFKATIKKEIEEKRSRGIRKDLFSVYDYILVFDEPSFETMKKLKGTFKKDLGESVVPKGKGKIVHLGKFKDDDNKTTDLWNPATTGNDKVDREKWNTALGKIKVSFKTWLGKEMGWTKPT